MGNKRLPNTPALAKAKAPAEGSRGARNRLRLIEAAMRVLLQDGMAQFTSAHIASTAGLHKPAFYAHFKNVEACLQAVALDVAKTNAREMLVLQTALPNSVPTLEQSQQLLEQMLRSVRQHETLYLLLARYRVEGGPLGAAVREIDDYVRERWVEHFWRLAVHFQIDARHFKEIAQLADHVVSISYAAIDRVLDGRATDLPTEAGRVARYGRAIAIAELRRMSAKNDANS